MTVCPGPGHGRQCESGLSGTPRGGRCRPCRLEGMRLSDLKKRGKLDAPRVRLPRRPPTDYAKRKAEEARQLRALGNNPTGIKAHERMINEAMRIA
jgi:hypothetical protein